MKPIMTVEDVAELLAVHPQTIRKWARAGKLTGADTPAGYRFTPEDLERWMDKYRHPVKQEPA